MKQINWRKRLNEEVDKHTRWTEETSLEFTPVTQNSTGGTFKLEFKGKVLGYLNYSYIGKQLNSIQFLNSDKSKSYLPEIFTSSVRNLKGREFEYDNIKDIVHFEGGMFNLLGLFRLFHEHGHSNENKKLAWYSSVSRAKRFLINEVESNQLQEVEKEPKELLLNQAERLSQIIGPFGDILKDKLVQLLVSKFDTEDINNILQTEFEATVFALEEIAKILIFLGMTEDSEIFTEIMQEVLHNGAFAYTTYRDETTPYEDFDIMKEQIERYDEWKEKVKWWKENNIV